MQGLVTRLRKISLAPTEKKISVDDDILYGLLLLIYFSKKMAILALRHCGQDCKSQLSLLPRTTRAQLNRIESFLLEIKISPNVMIWMKR